MKKPAILFAVLFLAAFIVLPAISIGKYNVSKPLVADGSPLPWPPVPPGGGALVADGWPLPPLPPGSISNSASSSETLVADGSPLPWPPNPPGGGTLVADGSPLPWPPNPPGGTTLV